MRASLLEYYKAISAPPLLSGEAASASGVTLQSPLATGWDLVQDFVDGYCRDLAPAGVLVVAPDPARAGALHTGIALTDGAHARRLLGLPSAQEDAAPAAERFWRVVEDVQEAMGVASLEGLFAGVHLAHAFPYAARDADGHLLDAQWLVRHDAGLRRLARTQLEHLITLMRPQAIACVGRFAFEAAAACATNAHALAGALSVTTWPEFVSRHRYAPSLADYPFADYKHFRARLVPLETDDPRFEAHARDTLAGLLADAWT